MGNKQIVKEQEFPIVVGTPVWVEDLDRRRGVNGERIIRGSEGVISKVGRKYFYVRTGVREEKFELETLVHQSPYGAQYRLWRDEEALERRMALLKKWQQIKDAVRRLSDEDVSSDMIEAMCEAAQNAGLIKNEE